MAIGGLVATVPLRAIALDRDEDVYARSLSCERMFNARIIKENHRKQVSATLHVFKIFNFYFYPWVAYLLPGMISAISIF